MDARERERLRQFVASPYFNRHGATADLLDFILKELGRSKPRLTEENARAAVNSTQSIASLQSALMKLINRFLAVEQLQAEPFREEVLTVKRTRELQRFKLLDNRGRRLETKISRHPYRDAAAHLAAYEWKNINGYRRGEDNRADTREMQAMLDHLDRYYIVEKLRHACQLTANMMQLNTHYDLLFLEPVLEYLNSDAGRTLLTTEPSVDVYYHILLSLREPDDPDHYARLLYYLGEGLSSLPADQQSDTYGFASNYCIQRIMSGHNDFRRALFDLYRRGIATGLMYDNGGEISEFNYKNVVTIGTAVQEFTWTGDFIESHRGRLPDKSRANAYALNKAKFLYARGELDAAAQLLVTVTDSDIIYHLARVILEVRIAYDQKDQDYALHLLENFRLYVRRSRRMSTKDKRSYASYVRLTRQLVNLKAQRGYVAQEVYRKKMAGLHDASRTTNPLVERGWLVAESAPPA